MSTRARDSARSAPIPTRSRGAAEQSSNLRDSAPPRESKPGQGVTPCPRAALPNRSKTSPETDRLEGFPHPRETFTLAGQDLALARAARAIRTGHPPQAWLITGPPGIGKATIAYRIARYMLAYGATDKGVPELKTSAVPEREPNRDAPGRAAGCASRLLLVLKRGFNDAGKLMNVLSVDVVRKLSGFFGMTSGAGGWRVAIVDTADDMNDAAANALLKMLEEPPPRALLLLLSNVPGRLLPTIRSRCQRLVLRPLDDARRFSNASFARLLPDSDAESERAALARLCGGSIGMALQLARGDSVMLAKEADRLLDNATVPDIAAILALGDWHRPHHRRPRHLRHVPRSEALIRIAHPRPRAFRQERAISTAGSNASEPR